DPDGGCRVPRRGELHLTAAGSGTVASRSSTSPAWSRRFPWATSCSPRPRRARESRSPFDLCPIPGLRTIRTRVVFQGTDGIGGKSMGTTLVAHVENPGAPVAEEFELSVLMPCLDEARPVGRWVDTA